MLLEIHPKNPDTRKINMVVQHLEQGGVIIFPTDTIYSFGCSLLKYKAIEKLARLKNVKPEKHNFSIICSNLSNLSSYAKVSNAAYKLMKNVLPGPYTFILPASNNVPKYFSTNKKTIGIRVPDNAICTELITQLGHPLVSTSIHDDDDIIEYSTDPELIYEKYKHEVDLVINGGYGGNIPSTVIDYTADKPILVREGAGNTDNFLIVE
jgi:tRNA threonylcarbamoyl adenosine modification protein (Sua5/YciO/YrdC/YwlC family)